LEDGLLTDDIVRLATLYQQLFDMEKGSEDGVHPFFFAEGTPPAIDGDGSARTSSISTYA